MHRARLLSIAVVVCALGNTARAHAQNTTTTPDGWVVLGVDEYRALRERAAPAPPRPDAPPVDATLTRIDYELQVDGDTVAGRAVLTIDALRDGWTRVEIPPALMARDARIDGQPVPMRAGERPAVLISRPGRSVVTLDISLPLGAAAGGESIRAAAVRRGHLARRAHAAAYRHRGGGGGWLPRRAQRDGNRDPMGRLRSGRTGADAVVEAQGGRPARRSAVAHARPRYDGGGPGRGRLAGRRHRYASRWCRARRARSRSRCRTVSPSIRWRARRWATGPSATVCCACGCSTRRSPRPASW